MNQPEVYGTFIKRDPHLFRTSAYIQWGQSSKSIGSCLMLNPGAANLERENKHLYNELETTGKAYGKVKPDQTMDQLKSIITGIYGEGLVGRFHIYNLFNLQNTAAQDAIDQFESLVKRKLYDIEEPLVSIQELQQHPWILIGWGINNESRWKNLKKIKGKWMDLIEWDMEESEPEIMEPHFYHDENGNPVVVLHTINDIGQVTLNQYIHVFSKKDYTLTVERKLIATAGAGIIF
jgi:hypothetical protein